MITWFEFPVVRLINVPVVEVGSEPAFFSFL